ncbi:MAG: glycosyltransferase family 1 protein [Candidatus Hydrogenedentes bacterium]|jgi:starch phosphorylase|nr:glycosyltransferase family 1 protein [Candidatus Hydrogenedentota bacterium]
MPQILKYTVTPKLPERLKDLEDIAYNMWWCWTPEAVDLFFRIDRELWTRVEHNPVRLLGEVSQARLEELAGSASFLAHLDRVSSMLKVYRGNGVWRSIHEKVSKDFLVAYFSAEFGLHESIKVYSGGLGILAGDHLKAASDLGMPLVGMGLLYREGYFRQYLNEDGWQQELYPKNDFHNMSITQERNENGSPLVIEVPFPGRKVKAYIWCCQVGRVSLYLLDCDHEENAVPDRNITAQLYGGDRETRIKQEIMLGMGGVIALKALGLEPTVYHINEGHAAFMTLQRIHDLIDQEGINFWEAAEIVRISSVFTTHTPVPAGNDMFDAVLIKIYFQEYCDALGISIDDLLWLGRQDPGNSREPFCMTVLALKLSAAANGVSKLHGAVARNMWINVWKNVPESELPITSVTNGVHLPTWVSKDLANLFDRYLGPDWVATPHDQNVWDRIDSVPDTELFRVHERCTQRLISFARRRVEEQLINRSAPSTEVRKARELLDGETLTIGFARRFATYKRATLLFKDPDRLRKILLNPAMPVQLIIAGKAHPQDTQSKEFIRQILHFARDPELRRHVVFIEDYDINVSRYMLQGVDCWLNTPRRPMEASGTSGMKAAANGALNISIPDGWWCEAEDLGENGWSIGKGESYDDVAEQDDIESQALYEILEQEIIPMFYNRGKEGLPREWVARMKNAIRTIAPVFNTSRMVLEYGDRFYVPCQQHSQHMQQNDRARIHKFTAWKRDIRNKWSTVTIQQIESSSVQNLRYGDTLEITAQIHLGDIRCDDVLVQIYHGGIDYQGNFTSPEAAAMTCVEDLGNGNYRYKGTAACETTGMSGCTVRVMPKHEDFRHQHEMGLIAWA